ncbi:MAG: T9SS type A sorting domain-containing protein, partial [Ferruginibacter sp.]
VNVAPNIAPTAIAGPDQTITLPVNSATLTGIGSDPDGSIVAYTWKQLSGPSNNVLFSLNTAITYANNLVVGTYEFELTVTDNLGASDKDTVKVIVNDATASLVIFNDAKIYPNPVVDIATLRINRIKLTTNPMVMIYDLQGKNVFSKEIISTQQSFTDKIDLRNLVKGTYFVTIYFDTDAKRTLKIIKQ